MLINAAYIVALTFWEACYIYHHWGKDGLYPFYVIIAWVFVLGAIAKETNLYRLYWFLFTSVGLIGMHFLAGPYCAFIGVQYLAAIFFGTFVTVLMGGFDNDEA